MPNTAKCFTYRFRGFARELRTEVLFSIPDGTKGEKFVAIRDTGATNTCISSRIVETLELTAVWFSQINTAGWVRETEDYYIDIWLPNGVVVKNVRVTKADLAGWDALIWMDIIWLWDFAISKDKDSNMLFSFIIPSQGEIDFVSQITKEHNRERLNIQEQQRKNWHNNRKKNKRK